MGFRFNAWGQLEKLSKEELRTMDDDPQTHIHVLDWAKTSDGRSYWAYIAIRPSQYQAFMDNSHAGTYRKYNDYGMVVRWGWGEDVPDAVYKEMKELYGYNKNCKEKIAARFVAAHEEFLKQRNQHLSQLAARMLSQKQ